MEQLGVAAIFLAAATVLGLLFGRLLLRDRARRAALWPSAARAAGLDVIEASRERLVARAGLLTVWLSHGEGVGDTTLITIEGPGLSPDLTIRRESPFEEGRDREVETGDAAFDATAWVDGPLALARAVLDSRNRRSLRALLEGVRGEPNGALLHGVLRIEIPHRPLGTGPPDSFTGGRGRLGDAVAAAIELARRLTTPADVARRLADNLKSERTAGVRLASLRVLVANYPDHPATREALLGVLDDPDPEVRLRAAIGLGPDGRNVLRALAADERADDETSARAVERLDADVAVDEAAGWLRSSLRTRRLATARECMVALGRRGGPQAVTLLARVLAVERGELGTAAARALAGTRDPEAEPPLLRGLAEGSDAVRLAAAAALGQVGTAASVGPLREAEAGDADMRRTARQAIAEIQARLTGAEPGQLSLAESREGALSLAEGEAGSLSLSDGETAAEDEEPVASGSSRAPGRAPGPASVRAPSAGRAR